MAVVLRAVDLRAVGGLFRHISWGYVTPLLAISAVGITASCLKWRILLRAKGHPVGLGYLTLGQPSITLSAGEAQRVKLAAELSRVNTGNTLYILDEPTTGLHFDDIRKLLIVLGRLVDLGNTVIVIEHNLDVIKTADWIIDLGPEGGDRGGYLVATGTPEQIVAIEDNHTGRFLRNALEQKPVS